MKIELVKETKWDGKVIYWLKVNGSYEKCFNTLEEAQEQYDKIIENGLSPKIEILKSQTV